MNSGNRLWRPIAAAVVLVAALTATPVLTSESRAGAALLTPKRAAAALCAAGQGVTRGTLANPALTELSGLVRSRDHRDVLWAHNDSGDVPRVFAVGVDGADLGIVSIGAATAVDWEDIALGPGPGGRDHLFVGDIGDNSASRPDVTVYRIPEPDPPAAGTGAAGAQRLTLRYPDGAHDAEALLIDARSGDLVIVTKVVEGRAGVYRAAGGARAAAGSTFTLERVGDLGETPDPSLAQRLAQLGGFGGIANRVTAADTNAAAGVAAVRAYGGVAIFTWPKRTSLADALLGTPCAAPAPTDVRFPQGEAIAIAPNGRSFITASEGTGAPLVEFRALRR
jgi:hypothetical protein